MKTWQLQDAKAHFSELVKAAHKAPQGVTVRGKEEVVVLARADYDRLAGKPKSFLALFSDPAIMGVDLEIGPRHPGGGRDQDLNG